MIEKIDAQYDEEKGTITDSKGKTWPVHFTLSEEERKELDSKLEELNTFCEDHAIPYHAACVVGRSPGNMEIRSMGLHFGARTPLKFAYACKAFRGLLHATDGLSALLLGMLAGMTDEK